MNGASRWPVASSDEDFTDFLSGASPAAVQMFWRFIALARECGAVTFELQRSRVVLRGKSRVEFGPPAGFLIRSESVDAGTTSSSLP